MPKINGNGDVLGGTLQGVQGGQGILSINGQPLPQLGLCGSARWLTNDKFIYTRDNRIFSYDVRTGKEEVFLQQAANWLEAEDGVWALRLQSNPPLYTDSFPTPNTSTRYYPRAISDGVVYATYYETGGGLVALTSGKATVLLAPHIPVIRNEVGRCGWVRLSPTELWHDVWGELKIPASTGLAAHKDGHLLLVQLLTGELVLVDTAGGEWAEIRKPGQAFSFDIGDSVGGEIRVAFATTAGEAASSIEWFDVNFATLKWHSLTEPPVVGECLSPHPQPLWVAPYHGVTDRWGDEKRNEAPVGNAILLTTEAPDEPLEKQRERTRRAGQQGFPIFLMPSMYVREVASLVVGLYLHEPTHAAMQAEVRRVEGSIGRGELPDAPLILYVDQMGAWEGSFTPYSAERHWISPQCYRDGGEPLNAFAARVDRELESIAGAGFKIIPTWHAFDRNGWGTVEEAVETWGLLPERLHTYPEIVGLLPFTDMRQGGGVGGMNFHPAIRHEAQRFVAAIPDVRPNRFSNWVPRFTSRKVVLANKLSQSRTLIHLSEEEKVWLRENLHQLPD